MNLYLRSYSYGGGCSDAVVAEIYRSAADIVYHSEYHDFYWGTSDVQDFVNQFGTFLDAASSYEIQFTLEHDAGVFGGAIGPIPIFSYPFNTSGITNIPIGDSIADTTGARSSTATAMER